MALHFTGKMGWQSTTPVVVHVPRLGGLLRSRSHGLIAGRIRCHRRLFELFGQLLKFFDREQQQLIRINALLPRSTDGSQELSNVTLQRRDQLIFLCERPGELFGRGSVLRPGFVKLSFPALQPSHEFLDSHVLCIHVLFNA